MSRDLDEKAAKIKDNESKGISYDHDSLERISKYDRPEEIPHRPKNLEKLANTKPKDEGGDSDVGMSHGKKKEVPKPGAQLTYIKP
jgi:hypothetical protein